MQLEAPKVPPRDTSAMFLMVSVNILLLSFFVVLMAITVPGKKHAENVLRDVREGYAFKSPESNSNGMAPRVPAGHWSQQQMSNIQGVVVNRLQLQTQPLVADADRVVLTLPAESLFNGGVLHAAEMVQALEMAAADADRQWVITGAAGAELAARGAALAQITGQARMVVAGGKESHVVLVLKPTGFTAPATGSAVQVLGGKAGGVARGESGN